MPPVTTMTDGAPDVAPDVARQAVHWLLELQSGPASEALRRDWRRWREAHPDHERAWQRIETVNGRLRGVGAAPVALDALAAASRARRRSVRLLGWGAVAGASALLLPRTATWQQMAATHRTGVGERLRLTLEDGTQVALNTDSALDVRYDAGNRLLVLRRGEVWVQSAPDPMARPLRVRTAQGHARAVGTRFSVQQLDDSTQVSVWDGRVELQPADAPGSVRLLKAGEQGHFTRASSGPPPAPGAPAAYWVDGMLVADDWPLARFLQELARHRVGVLRCDPAVAQLRISGTYPLDDTDRVLAALPAALPVDVRMRTRYWVTVGPAPEQQAQARR